MRNSTVIVLGLTASMTMTSAAAKSMPFDMVKDAKVKVFNKAESAERRVENGERGMMRMSEMAKRMKPGVTKTFGWDGETWMPEDVYSYTYDKEGNVTVENAKSTDGGFTRTVYGYDDCGMMNSKETYVSKDGVSYVNSTKSAIEYDPILTKVIVNREEWLWMDGEWSQNANNYHRIITRDDAGNITNVTIAVLFQGIYDPTIKLDVTYGTDGKACELSEQVLNFDYTEFEYYWEQGTKITDIVWERTDGQIYDIEDLFTGNNRISSAHYIDPDGLDMNVSVEYAEDGLGYTATIEMTDDGMTITGVSVYTPLENDGYIGEGTTYFMGQELYSSREEYRYDDWGFMTLSYEEEREDGDFYYQKSVGEVEYDSEGKPATYTVSESYIDDRTGKEVTDYVIRAEYSDYVDVTASVGNVLEVDGLKIRYDLKGMPVGKDYEGIVIEGNRKIKY